MKRLAGVLHAALFLAACALGCWLIGRCRPIPDVSGFYAKWNYFRAHRGEFDTIFIGSSRVFHHFIPQQFDAELARAGFPTKSFNFGCDAMWPPESYYALRRILRLRPPGLKHVFIDLMDIDSRLDERNDATLRMAYWHDLPHTVMAVRDAAARPLSWENPWPPGKRSDLIAEHLLRGALQMLNIGYGSDLLQRRFQPKKSKPEHWLESAGWLAGKARGLDEKELANFRGAIAALKNGPPPTPVRPVFRDALAGIIAEVHRAGAEPIFVLAPTITGPENYVGVPEGAVVWKFNDPREYPKLFEPGLRYDLWHLNAEGAVVFTHELAGKFLGEQARGR